MKILSAKANPFVPPEPEPEPEHQRVPSSSDFPPLGSAWANPLTPKIYEMKLNESSDKYKDHILSLNKELSISQDKLTDSKVTIGALRSQVGRIQSANRSHVERIQSANSSLTERLEEEQWTTKSLRDKITAYEEHQKSNLLSLAEKDKRITENKSDIENYRGRLSAAAVDCDHFQRVIYDLKDKSQTLTDQLAVVSRDLISFRRERNTLRERLSLIQDTQSPDEEWIGRTLKLRYLFDQIQKLGVLPDDHAEWILPMVEDMEIPEVSRRIRDRFLPSYTDAHMEEVDPEVERDQIAEWSREAAAHSALLGDNPEQTIAAIGFIQRIVRGYITRRRISSLFGDNPQERIKAANLIQRIYRGFRGRNVRFYTDEDNIFTNLGFISAPMALSRSVQYTATDRRSIRFINTGSNNMYVIWIRGNGSGGRPLTIPSGTVGGISLATFRSHWFMIIEEQHIPTTNLLHPPTSLSCTKKYIRIPDAFKNNSYFDVNTGFTFSQEHWEQRRTRQLPNISSHSTTSDFLEDQDEARLQLAIQMSLDFSTQDNMYNSCNFPLTDDSTNWSPYFSTIFQ